MNHQSDHGYSAGNWACIACGQTVSGWCCNGRRPGEAGPVASIVAQALRERGDDADSFEAAQAHGCLICQAEAAEDSGFRGNAAPAGLFPADRIALVEHETARIEAELAGGA